MDNDIFFDDSEIDSREVERRLAENEMKKRAAEIWDKGYLGGLEWAESNYLQYLLEDNHLTDFRNGVESGIELSEIQSSLFSEAGSLNAYMLLVDSKPIQFQAERQDVRAMLERLNIGIGDQASPIDQNLLEDSRMLKEKIDQTMAQH